MKVDKKLTIAVRRDVEAALTAVAEKHGLIFDGRSKWHYDGTSMDGKVAFKTLEHDQYEWNQWAYLYELKSSDLGQVIRMGGQRLMIAGVAPRNTRYPILLADPKTGKVIKKASAHSVRAALYHSGGRQ